MTLRRHTIQLRSLRGNLMTEARHSTHPGYCLAGSRSGVTSLMFAIMAIPLILILGIAIDFSFYVGAQAELNLAADAAAMHAVRAAEMAKSNGTTPKIAGRLAGEEWFAAQAEVVPGVTLTGTGTPLKADVVITYSPPSYTATVSYSGTLNTIFGRIVGVPTWPIAGTAQSTISNNFVDIGIMIDNSQSMLIGSTTTDINNMNLATPCAVVKTEGGVTPGLGMAAYSYYFNGPGSAYGQGAIGYGTIPGTKQFQTLPHYKTNTSPATEFCDPNLIGGCTYPPSFIYGTNDTQYYTTAARAKATNTQVGSCYGGGGAPGAVGANTPQAPCAFACHQNPDGGDWYDLARKLNVTLRLDVVQNAAQSVISSMQKYSNPAQSLLSVGIYTFNSTFQPVYPCTSVDSCASPFGTDLTTASDDLIPCTRGQTSGCLLPPITKDSPNTDFPNVFAQAAQFLKGTAGTGATAATALKNLFIITDGISDWPVDGTNTPVAVAADGSPLGEPNVTQVVGPIDQLIAKPCDAIKASGVTVYVLYTPYEPLPTWTYSSTTNPYAEPAGLNYYPKAVTLQNYVTELDPTSFPDYNATPIAATDTPVAAALRACASEPSYFYTASDKKGITDALNAMLALALNSAARVTN